MSRKIKLTLVCTVSQCTKTQFFSKFVLKKVVFWLFFFEFRAKKLVIFFAPKFKSTILKSYVISVFFEFLRLKKDIFG